MTPFEKARQLYQENYERTLDEALRTLHGQRVYNSLGDGLAATTTLLKSFGCSLSDDADWRPIGRDESGKYEIDIGLRDKKLFLGVYRGPEGQHEFYSCLIGAKK